jgi:uncharacterized protein YjbJ (UPF0337 family)
MENNLESNPVNQDIFAGRWKQLRGELKTWWGKLNDDDLDRVGGQKDKLVGLIQERYGYAREQAEQEVDWRLGAYRDRTGGTVADMAAKARELGSTAASKANEAAPVLGDKVGTLASAIRDKAPRDGKLSRTANKVADGLESASYYLQERKLEHLGEDFSALVRRYPLQSIAVGFALGFLLAGGSVSRRERREENY